MVPIEVVYVAAVGATVTTKLNVVPLTRVIFHVPFKFVSSVPTAPVIVMISPVANPVVSATVPIIVVDPSLIKLTIDSVVPFHLNSIPRSFVISTVDVAPPSTNVGSSIATIAVVVVVVVPFTVKSPPTTTPADVIDNIGGSQVISSPIK